MAPEVFDPMLMGNLGLRNRFVLAAAAPGTAADDSGNPTIVEIERLTQNARSGFGLIITGAMGITEQAISHPLSSLLADDRNISGFSRLTGVIHEEGGKIAAQLCHPGLWTGFFNMTKAREAIAPSRVSDSYYTDRPGFTDHSHEVYEKEILDVIMRFGGAGSRAVPGGATITVEPGSGRNGEVCNSAGR